MENLRSDDTLGSVFLQGYFDFMYNVHGELTADEKALSLLLDGLDYSRFDSTLHRKPKFPAKRVCMLIIYSYMNCVFSTRDMERFASRNVFAIALFGMEGTIDHSTLCRFIERNSEELVDLFYQLVVRLGSLGELGKETVFQDGTKAESRAGRYTFLWRGTLESGCAKCIGRMRKLVDLARGLGLVDRNLAVTDDNVVQILTSLIGDLSQLDLDRDAPRGRGHRVDARVKLEEQAKEEVKKLTTMENDLAEMGSGRNSMSKTDRDATFMRMKDDAMKNGQLKPAYNMQNAVDSGYIVACTVSSSRTDYSTLAPTLEELEKRLPWSYRNYVADSGYDSVENFQLLEGKGINAYIKPQDWEMGRKRKVANDIGRYQNMKYDSDRDEFECANGKKLVLVREKATKNGTVSKTYSCRRGCVSCPVRKQCMKTSRKKYKTFDAVMEHWEYRKKAYELLKADRGIEMRLNRSIMVEGSFAQIKNNLGLRRFSHFGKDKILLVWILVAMSANIMHFASRHFEQGISGTPYWYSPGEDDSQPA